MTTTAEVVKKRKKFPPKKDTPSPEHNHTLIKHVDFGETFTGIYYAEAVYQKTARNGNKYTDLTLRDKSGSSFVRFWGIVKCLKGDYVAISANVEEYMGQKQIVASQVKTVDVPNDMDDYIESSDSTEDDWKTIQDAIKQFREGDFDPTCLALLDQIFENEAFVDRFRSCPASMMPHYGKRGGLLRHTVKTYKFVLAMAGDFDLTKMESDILMTAALLHGIGVVDAYTFDGCAPTETLKGKLIGDEVLTCIRVQKNVMSIRERNEGDDSDRGADPIVVIRLVHAIVAHKGEYKQPMTKEAMILHESYRANRDVVDTFDFIDQDENTNDEFTAYDPNTRRQYLRGLTL